MHNTKNLKWCI